MFQFIQKFRDNFYYYHDGKIVESSNLPNIQSSWNFGKYLNDLENVKVLEIYLKGNSELSYFSEKEKSRYEFLVQRKCAYLNSLKNANVDYSKVPIINIIPNSLLLELFQMRDLLESRISEPKEYKILLKIFKIIRNLEDLKVLGDFKKKKISYNPFRVKTGRMGLNKGFFPILTLNKDLRKNILSKNGVLVELDYNAADIRSLSGLLNIEQSKEDYYTFLRKTDESREKTKKNFYGWLYNPEKYDNFYDNLYNLEMLKKEYFKDSQVYTIFGREISSDNKRWISHLIQSTSSDVFFEQVFKLWTFLKDYKSKISFTLHDSVVLDVFESELFIIPKLLELFNLTRFGKYYNTHLKIGTNFGEMRTVENINDVSI